jgi:hypothetical protein
VALRKVTNVRITRYGGWRVHYEIRAPAGGGQYWRRRVSQDEYSNLKEAQRHGPICVLMAEGRTWWWYRDEFYHENDGYSSEDVKLLVWDREKRKERKIERLRKEMLSERAIDEARRERIPEDVRIFVWKRDGGRCVQCGSRENLEFDHIIAVSKGGSNTARNIQLLCETCNRKKSDSI